MKKKTINFLNKKQSNKLATDNLKFYQLNFKSKINEDSVVNLNRSVSINNYMPKDSNNNNITSKISNNFKNFPHINSTFNNKIQKVKLKNFDIFC